MQPQQTNKNPFGGFFKPSQGKPKSNQLQRQPQINDKNKDQNKKSEKQLQNNSFQRNLKQQAFSQVSGQQKKPEDQNKLPQSFFGGNKAGFSPSSFFSNITPQNNDKKDSFSTFLKPANETDKNKPNPFQNNQSKSLKPFSSQVKQSEKKVNSEKPVFGFSINNPFGNTDKSAFGNTDKSVFGNTDKSVFGNTDKSVFGNTDKSAFGKKSSPFDSKTENKVVAKSHQQQEKQQQKQAVSSAKGHEPNQKSFMSSWKGSPRLTGNFGLFQNLTTQNTDKKVESIKSSINNEQKVDTNEKKPNESNTNFQNLTGSKEKPKDSQSKESGTPVFGPRSDDQVLIGNNSLKKTISREQNIQAPILQKQKPPAAENLPSSNQDKIDNNNQQKINISPGSQGLSGVGLLTKSPTEKQKQGSLKSNPQPPFPSFSFPSQKADIDDKSENKQKPKNDSQFLFSNKVANTNLSPSSVITNNSDKKNIQGGYYELSELESVLDKQLGISREDGKKKKQNRQKIANSFQIYLAFMETAQPTQSIQAIRMNQNIPANQGMNKLLNDFSFLINETLQLSSKSYEAFGQLFYDMLTTYKLDQKLFQGSQVIQDTILLLKIYKFENNNIVFMKEQKQTINLIIQFVNYYVAKLAKCIQLVKKMPDFLAQYKIIELLFQKLLILGKRTPETKIVGLFSFLKQTNQKLIQIIENLIMEWIKSKKTQKILTPQKLKNLVGEIDELPVGEVSQIVQRVILQMIYSQKGSKKQIYRYFETTRSQILMPFKIFISKDKNFTLKMSKIVRGSHWIDWMQQYLQSAYDYTQQRSIKHIMASLQSFKDGARLITYKKNPYIYKFIQNLRYNHISVAHFYEALSIITTHQEVISDIQKHLFKGENTIVRELKPLINQIKNYPQCQFAQQDINEIKAKAHFYLTVIKTTADRAFEFQNAFFDIHGFGDQKSNRCDRVCHTVLDILGFFSNNCFSQQILANALQATIALIQSENSKIFMSLAMNVNRPDLSFLNRNLSQKCIEQFGKFLTHILNTQQFYDSVRSADMSLQSSRAYPIRYNIQKYLLATTQHKANIPVYWFANGLKVLTKRIYNPKLLHTILQKLIIIPSAQIYAIDRPYILQSIADACNSENFWQQFIQTFETSSLLYDQKLVLQNKFLEDQTNSAFVNKGKQQPLFRVFYSVKLLKVMFQLNWIAHNGQKNSPKHFITNILSSLKCLKDTERHFIYGSEISSYSSLSNYNHRISAAISLIALIKYRFVKINYSRDSAQKQWGYLDTDGFNAEKLLGVYKGIQNNIDYFIVRDNLTHPNNKYLQNCDSIATIALDCLTYIIKNTNEINIQASLYGSIPSQNNIKRIEITSWKTSIIEDIILCLGSTQLTLSVSAWNFLLTLRQTYHNVKFSSEIFERFISKYPKLSELSSTNLLISQYILKQYRENNFIHHKQVTVLLEVLNRQSKANRNLYNLDRLCNVYENKVFPITVSLHEFQRVVIEREITFVTEIYQQIQNLTEMILRQFYARKIEAQCHSQQLTYFVAQNKLLSLIQRKSQTGYNNKFQQRGYFNANDETMDQIDQLRNEKQQAFQGPLKFEGIDPLNAYIVQKELTRENVSDIQKQNVLNCAKLRSGKLLKSLHQYYSIMLSIDDTFYANHPIETRNRQFNSMFCQLHLGRLPTKAEFLLGESLKDSAINAKKCIEDCLQKIEKLRSRGLSQQMIELFQLIDLFLNWLKNNQVQKQPNTRKKNNKNIEKQDEIITQVKRITSVCFTWLGEQVIHPVPAKLLLSLVSFGERNFSQQVQALIKQTVSRTILSQQVLADDVKQFLLPILLILPPQKNQMSLVNLVVKMWTNAEKHQYFYNISRVLLKLCQLYPIQICKAKFLTKSSYMLSQIDGEFQHYNNGLRTQNSLCWLWILKIVACLAELSDSSTIIIYEISQFVKKYKNKILHTLNAPRSQVLSHADSGTSGGYRSSISSASTLKISLAKLDELQYTLQLLGGLFKCNMWVVINRTIFEELLYSVMHRTVFLFAGNNSVMGIKVRKMYIPYSDCEKAMWDMDLKGGMIKNQYQGIYQSISMDAMDQEITTNMLENSTHNPSVFMLLMSIRLQDCAKIWMTDCSLGMKNSYFTQEYFKSPIFTDSKGNKIRYSITHWEHFNKTINQIVVQDLSRIQKWAKWNKLNDLLLLIKDCYQSPQIFIELGYINTTMNLPEKQQDMMASLSINIALALQMASYHLLSQVHFKRKNGTLITSNLKRFREKITKLSFLAQKNFSKHTQENQIQQNIAFGRDMLESIMIT